MFLFQYLPVAFIYILIYALIYILIYILIYMLIYILIFIHILIDVLGLRRCIINMVSAVFSRPFIPDNIRFL